MIPDTYKMIVQVLVSIGVSGIMKPLTAKILNYLLFALLIYSGIRAG